MEKHITITLSETEIKILEAAKKVFIEKGFDGASMQDIANEAGINKALLHYYFRKKEFLFKAIFKQALYSFIPNLLQVIQSNESIRVKLKMFVDNYTDMLLLNPHIPVFVLHEFSRRPEILVSAIKELGVNHAMILQNMEKGVVEAGGTAYPAKHLLVNMLAICIFPFAAKPILTMMLFSGNDEEYQKFASERKQLVYEFLLKALNL